jgi:hypothetical protein
VNVFLIELLLQAPEMQQAETASSAKLLLHTTQPLLFIMPSIGHFLVL